jgi:two-component system sensor histidine kinase PhoQ
MRSLNARLLLAATLVLAAFLGLTGLALDRAFRESALAAVQDRLQSQIYILLSAASFTAPEKRLLPTTLPDPRLSAPGSGLYAQVARADGSLVWRSSSMLGLSIPLIRPAAPGLPRFEAVTASDGSRLYVLALTVRWQEKSPERVYLFQAAEDRGSLTEQVQSFRRNLWGWLAAAGVVLLLVQAVILRWGLWPLRQVAEAVAAVEAGRETEVGGAHPLELQRLVINLNALIRHSKAQMDRYRRALGDLAHSFKTPLAVLRSAVDSGVSVRELRDTVREQVGRLDRTVAYQLQRAAASGRSVMSTPLPVAPVVGKIVPALAKVYAGKQLRIETPCEGQPQFPGDEGDLMEVIGNLADNACKWARSRVVIRSAALGAGEAATSAGAGLLIEVEDDGPGIPPAQWQAIFTRGYRGDMAVEGQGIGLAVVKEIVEEVYRGTLAVDTGALGGARVQVRITL